MDTDPCPICGGCLWVCEDHPDKPMDHDDCGGAGVPCACNPQAQVLWREVFAQAPDAPDEPVQ